MSETVLKLYGVASAGCSYAAPNETFNTSTTVKYGEGEDLYIQFDGVPEAYQYRDIINLTPYVYCTGLNYSYSGAKGKIEFSELTEPFDPDTVTDYTAPNRKSIEESTVYRDDVPAYLTCYPEGYIGTIRNILAYGLLADGSDNLVLATTRHSKKPYIELRLSDADVSIQAKNLAAEWGVFAAGTSFFKWIPSPTGYSFTEVKPVSATLQWTADGGATVHSITASSTTRCAVPARTFPVGKISVRVSITSSSGITNTSEWKDFDCLAPHITEEAPASGYVPKYAPTVFSWKISQATLPQTSATFRWRAGATGAINTINVAGASTSLTVPSGTFASDEIQWQVVSNIEGGFTATSVWRTLSTVEAIPTAKVLSPQSTVVDGTTTTLFQWAHIIETNTAQSKADLQKSADSNTWETLATVAGPETQWLCPAGTLTTSVKFWRVRTYNTDNVAGEWSDAAQIVVIAAPTAPSIQIKSTGPRPSISWQTSEQEAYQVELDGVLSGGTHYGTEKTWTSPAYLSDGSHTVRVRVQNQYGMWSDWGAAALPVTNTPGASITLTVQASSVANLSWQTSGSYDFYLVYRNGKPIAKLTQTQYTDELSSGSTTYQVRGCYADSSDYGLSSAVTVDVRARVHQVSDLDTGQTLRLPYSDSQHRQTTRTLSRQVELLQLSGAYYPVAVEVDSGTDALSITAALLDEGEIRQLMGLVGKLVCAKTPQGDMVIGYITSLPKQHDGFLNVFNFTIEQIDFDDEVTL